MPTNEEKQEKIENEKKTIFIVCPIGDADSDERKRSDQLMRHLVEPAFPGYEIVRADQISYPGSITYHIVAAIANADLVVVDMTDYNPNVFYEMAIAHGFRKPVIHMITEGSKIPFDVAHMRAIHYDLTDPDRVVAVRTMVQDQGKYAMEKPNDITTPVSQANAFRQEASEGDAERLLMTDLVHEMREMMRNELSSISRDRFISKPANPAVRGFDVRENLTRKILRSANEIMEDQRQSIDNKRSARRIRNEVIHMELPLDALNLYHIHLAAILDDSSSNQDEEQSRETAITPENLAGS